jgi:high-affinity Fe2+/Pb2+ permease
VEAVTKVILAFMMLFGGGHHGHNKHQNKAPDKQPDTVSQALATKNNQKASVAVPEPPNAGIIFAGAGITVILLRKCQKQKMRNW